MRFGRPRIEHEATFDLTAMIDVVLLLIIFFTLTSHFARTQLAPVDLPIEKGLKPAAAADASVVIDLGKDGDLTILGLKTSLPDATAMIEQELSRLGPALDLTIRADRACPAAYLNQLAESLARVGVRQWKLATAGPGGGGGGGGGS